MAGRAGLKGTQPPYYAYSSSIPFDALTIDRCRGTLEAVIGRGKVPLMRDISVSGRGIAMQSCIVAVSLVLMGQLGGAAGDRYGTPASQAPQDDLQENQAQQNSGVAQQPVDYPPITPRETPVAPPSAQNLFEGQQSQPPASSYSPPAAKAEIAVAKPAELLRGLSADPLRGRLVGTELSLADAVSSARSRAEQTARVESYWELSAAVANYNLAVRAATELEALQNNISQPSNAWDEARLALTSRIQVARRSAEAAQFRLQSLLGRSEASNLPLPSDSPHCGAYQTRYDQNFAGRPAAEAAQLNELLPKLYEDLLKQAKEIAADQQWLQTVDRQRNPQSDGTVLLKTYELVNLRRSAFIDAVSQYNTSITRYAELATPGEVGADRLVAMLIGRPRVQTRIDSEVTRTSAEEPATNQNNPQTPPKTFAEKNPIEDKSAITPADGVERSILRKPSQGDRP